MVAPILQLALAGGVLGGRALSNRRQTNRVNAQASTLTELLMGGRMGAGGVGPPTPGLGQEISATDRAMLNHLQQTDPQAALAMASRLNEQLRPVRAAQQQQAARQAAAFDPAQASNLALQEGRESYQVFDQPSGDLVNVAAQGSKEWNENVAKLRATNRIVATVLEMQELVRQVEPGGTLLDTDDPIAQRLDALQAGLIADIKDADALGALDAGLLEFAERIAPAGGKLADLFATPEALEAALQGGSERFAKRLDELRFDTRYYTGLNPALQADIEETTARRAVNAERIAGFDRPATSRAATVRPAAQEGAQLVQEVVRDAANNYRQGGVAGLLFGVDAEREPGTRPDGTPLPEPHAFGPYARALERIMSIGDIFE